MKLNASTITNFRIKPEQRYYYFIVGNLVVLALIGIFVLRPVMGLLGKHAAEINTVKADIVAAREKTSTLRTLEETLPATQAVYVPIIKNAPKTKDIAGYQTELEDLAELTEVDLLTVDTSGTSPEGNPGTAQKDISVGGFPAFPITIDITGSYANILDFVNRLETMDRFTRVTGLDFVQLDSSGEVKLTIAAQSIYFGK